MTSPILIATDLDRTLIYSRAASQLADTSAVPLTCVEIYEGQPISFMAEKAVNLIRDLEPKALVVPVSTRTTSQLMRVRIPYLNDRFAVAANGGVLLVDGHPDEGWSCRVRARLSAGACLDEVWKHANEVFLPAWTSSLRIAEDLFCYMVVDRDRLPIEFVSEITDWAAERGWTTSLQGRKFYLVPTSLTKSAAIAEIAHRTKASLVLAAGDSLLDIDLLASADLGIHPNHGEIAALGWTAPHVSRTRASGIQAGEEICQWFTDKVQT